ncbi:hypothetical protein [Mucilaginibacter jinjuensis]|uniref:Thiopeptide-type bacteriocin biosynthesis protein n=1 Tax=Mucilaginibacter jinjuensis TaxID=1176721 RepID=A0ABY7TEL1_9SPHI|nr:hypothetical protein [Mucilaginibacter jinjuensis]WCT14481.1 hypothetical protein PQO05_11110 [Mucilaginibacter jinjuensis]
MNTSLIYVSVYYSSSKWRLILDRLSIFFNAAQEPFNLLLFLDNQKGDAIRLIICVDEHASSNFKYALRADLETYIQNNPSRRKRNILPGEYLWQAHPNNSWDFNYFNCRFSFVNYSLKEFELNAHCKLALAVSRFLLHTISKDNILSKFCSLILLIIKTGKVEVTASLFLEIIGFIEQKSEFKQARDQLNLIYAHAADDLTANKKQLADFINNDLSGLSLNLDEKDIMEKAGHIFLQYSSLGNTTAFSIALNTIINLLGIDYRKQLYVIRIFYLFYLNEHNLMTHSR